MKAEIFRWLERVDLERRRREADPELARKVHEIKRYQQRRFEWTYRDLLASPRYREAAGFFLVDLYGPVDFRQRDEEFARVVPKIEALFPAEISATVLDLAHLHALSEELDSAMAMALSNEPIGPSEYMRLWLEVGRRADRESQLAMVMAIGKALDRYTRHAWLVRILQLMRAPARAAALSSLQHFLERGMTSFRSMRGATEFLAIIESRESELMRALFAGDLAAQNELPT